jgi:hypothetical protein
VAGVAVLLLLGAVEGLFVALPESVDVARAWISPALSPASARCVGANFGEIHNTIVSSVSHRESQDAAGCKPSSRSFSAAKAQRHAGRLG